MALSCSRKISALLHEITSKRKSDSYYLNCFHSFRAENKVCKNKDFCGIVMRSEKVKTL